jgi:hypothetical protein
MTSLGQAPDISGFIQAGWERNAYGNSFWHRTEDVGLADQRPIAACATLVTYEYCKWLAHLSKTLFNRQHRYIVLQLDAEVSCLKGS